MILSNAVVKLPIVLNVIAMIFVPERYSCQLQSSEKREARLKTRIV
jgi:hypothetical protein